MKEWGSKYNTETEAWEVLKGICGRSDIQLQDQVAETEKEILPEKKAKIKDAVNESDVPAQAEVIDETKSEQTPLMKDNATASTSEKRDEPPTVNNRTHSIGTPYSDSNKGTSHDKARSERNPLMAKVGNRSTENTDETTKVTKGSPHETTGGALNTPQGSAATQDTVRLLGDTQGTATFKSKSSQ